jgi:hypothetical protein
MRSLRAPLCGIILLSLFAIKRSTAHAQQAPQNAPTIRVTSRLVFLDVTVVDKKGRPVVKGLTKDDFTITEDKKPQRIFSFEAPDRIRPSWLKHRDAGRSRYGFHAGHKPYA